MVNRYMKESHDNLNLFSSNDCKYLRFSHTSEINIFLSFHSIMWDKKHLWYLAAMEAEIKTQKEVNKSWVVCWNRKQDKSTRRKNSPLFYCWYACLICVTCKTVIFYCLMKVNFVANNWDMAFQITIAINMGDYMHEELNGLTSQAYHFNTRVSLNPHKDQDILSGKCNSELSKHWFAKLWCIPAA